MNYALARAHVPVISRFLRPRVLLAFDFDGTLAPIVADRTAARMRRRTVRLLQQISRAYPCAVISGRSPEDVGPRLEGLPVRFVVGHHGQDPSQASSAVAGQVAAARLHLAAVLESSGGVEIEDKRLSLAIHYRRASAREKARSEIARALRDLPGAFRVLPGKRVYDVLPAAAPHKGDALERVRRVANADAAIYVGDDVTDEDVFRRAHPKRLLAIRVGRSQRSAAPYYLRDQRDLDAFLEHVALTCA